MRPATVVPTGEHGRRRLRRWYGRRPGRREGCAGHRVGEREQHVEERDPVAVAVMYAHDDGAAAPVARDQVKRPERPPGGQRRAGQLPGQRLQLSLARGCRQRRGDSRWSSRSNDADSIQVAPSASPTGMQRKRSKPSRRCGEQAAQRGSSELSPKDDQTHDGHGIVRRGPSAATPDRHPRGAHPCPSARLSRDRRPPRSFGLPRYD